MRAAAFLAWVLTWVTPAALSQDIPAVDAFYGAWTLDGAHSHYGRGAAPQQMKLVIEADPTGLAYRSDTYLVGGRVTSSHFVARLDATPTLVVGTSGFLSPVALRVIDDRSIDAVYTSGLKKVAWSRWSVNQARSELLITTTYLTSEGEQIENVAAFGRAEPG